MKIWSCKWKKLLLEFNQNVHLCTCKRINEYKLYFPWGNRTPSFFLWHFNFEIPIPCTESCRFIFVRHLFLCLILGVKCIWHMYSWCSFFQNRSKPHESNMLTIKHGLQFTGAKFTVASLHNVYLLQYNVSFCHIHGWLRPTVCLYVSPSITVLSMLQYVFKSKYFACKLSFVLSVLILGFYTRYQFMAFYIWEKTVFMPPAWKVRRGHLVIGSFVFP